MEIPAPLPLAPQTIQLARAERMAWLVRLRWFALGGVLVGALAAGSLGLRHLNLPVLFGAVAVGVTYNAWFAGNLRRHPDRAGNPLLHALPDFGALTLVLWASGGPRNPFLSLYFVHVLLVSVLSGRRAGILACATALFCIGLLGLTSAFPFLQISAFDPEPALESTFDAAAFVITLLAAAYVADRASTELALRRREAEAAKRAMQRDAEILLSALDRLEVGVEMLDAEGKPTFRNRHLLERRGMGGECPRDSHVCETPHTRCPVLEAREGKVGSCRFAVHDGGGRERVIELLSFPLSDERPAPVLRLHLDRTEAVLAERRLLFAERLASLGRTVQAVAHELNTPLATIQTLAADMRAALQTAPPEAAALVKDLDESALVILDEMRRCREITQGLLSGRDSLAGGTSNRLADVGGAVRRAATLVFGTTHAKTQLVIDPRLAGLTASIPHDALVQVFVNLLQNAADVIEGRPGAKVRVALGGQAGGRITVHVDDDGPGLSPGSRDRVFEAFFTTKPPGKGTGLGLYTASNLVREAGGSLDLGDAPGGGARARLELLQGGTA